MRENKENKEENSYPENVFHNYLISPLDGSKRKRIEIRHLKKFDYTWDKFKEEFPNFPKECKSYKLKLNETAKKASKSGVEVIKNRIKKLKKEYDKNPKHCKECDKKIPYEERVNDFCDSSCSASHNNRNRKHTEQRKSNISKSLKGRRKVCRIRWCKITGLPISRDRPKDESIWYDWPNTNWLERMARAFNIQIGMPEAIPLLDQAVLQLKELYEDNSSAEPLAKLIGVRYDSIHGFLAKIGVKIRSASESNSIRILKFGIATPISENIIFKHGWHTDWQGIEHYYRSSYELAFYKNLDIEKIKYETETLRIQYYDSQSKKVRIAIPDIIIDNDIIEIKSVRTLDIQNMKDKFIAYHEAGYFPHLVLKDQVIDLYNIPKIIEEQIRKARVGMNN